MADIRIPRDLWWTFCESFTQDHQGKPVEMTQCPTGVLDAGAGHATPALLFAGQRPLQEVRQGQRDDDVVELMVSVGEGAEETSYLIKDAIAFYHRDGTSGRKGLRVDCGDGTTTLVELAEPAPGGAKSG